MRIGMQNKLTGDIERRENRAVKTYPHKHPMETKCRDCKHLLCLDSDSPLYFAWVNYRCLAYPLPFPRRFDYEKSELEPQQYDYCYDLNCDGECPRFGTKETE